MSVWVALRQWLWGYSMNIILFIGSSHGSHLGTSFSSALHSHLGIDRGSDKLVRNVHHWLDCKWTINTHNDATIRNVYILQLRWFSCWPRVEHHCQLCKDRLPFVHVICPATLGILLVTCCCHSWLRWHWVSGHLCKLVFHPLFSRWCLAEEPENVTTIKFISKSNKINMLRVCLKFLCWQLICRSPPELWPEPELYWLRQHFTIFTNWD